MFPSEERNSGSRRRGFHHSPAWVRSAGTLLYHSSDYPHSHGVILTTIFVSNYADCRCVWWVQLRAVRVGVSGSVRLSRSHGCHRQGSDFVSSGSLIQASVSSLQVELFAASKGPCLCFIGFLFLVCLCITSPYHRSPFIASPSGRIVIGSTVSVPPHQRGLRASAASTLRISFTGQCPLVMSREDRAAVRVPVLSG